jgi:hypothetical protein
MLPSSFGIEKYDISRMLYEPKKGKQKISVQFGCKNFIWFRTRPKTTMALHSAALRVAYGLATVSRA